jgi:preprotein translocase SecE subunit
MKSEKKTVKKEKKQVVEADIVEEKVKKEKSKTEKKKESKKAVKKEKVKKAKGEGFFKEVIKELKRTKWPDKKYMVKYSVATFATIIISSVYFYAIFALFSYLKGLR